MDARREETTSALSWSVGDEGDRIVVRFVGEIDENSDFAELTPRLRGTVTFHLGDVRYINSCGVREWVNFVRSLDSVAALTFTHCSPAVVAQLNMVYNFRGTAQVETVFVPYYCEHCHNEQDRLFEPKGPSPVEELEGLPPFVCESCGETMECDELPERYFAFMLVS